MKYNKLHLISLLVFIVFYTQNNITAHTLDQIIAIIDDNIILDSDIKNTKILDTKYNENYFYKQKNNKYLSEKEILNQLITNAAILQLAKRTNIHINDDQIENIINYITEENHITKTELKSYLNKNNINYTDYVNHIKNDVIINTICNYEMQQRIKISPHELNTLTKKLILKSNNTLFQLDHILIPLQENATNYQIQKACSLSNFLIKEMKHGININKLIQLYSKNQNFQTIQTNKIHWSTIKELPTLFAKHLIKNTICINNIIGPIHSNIGFHILKINDINNYIQKDITTKVHIRHIFIKTSNINTDQKIQAQLLTTKERINNNYTTFSIEAQQISEDHNSSDNGGDLGWKYLEDFNNTFQNAIKSLNVGEITTPIKTNHGWHIIQLVNSEQIDKNEIFYQKHAYQIIFNKKLHEIINHWIQELKMLTYITIFKK